MGDELWLSLFVFVLSMVVGVGGLLHAINGNTYGWRLVGVSVVAHFFNSISLAVYLLQ